jgi:hypothetical protein
MARRASLSRTRGGKFVKRSRLAALGIEPLPDHWAPGYCGATVILHAMCSCENTDPGIAMRLRSNQEGSRAEHCRTGAERGLPLPGAQPPAPVVDSRAPCSVGSECSRSLPPRRQTKHLPPMPLEEFPTRNVPLRMRPLNPPPVQIPEHLPHAPAPREIRRDGHTEIKPDGEHPSIECATLQHAHRNTAHDPIRFPRLLPSHAPHRARTARSTSARRIHRRRTSASRLEAPRA